MSPFEKQFQAAIRLLTWLRESGHNPRADGPTLDLDNEFEIPPQVAEELLEAHDAIVALLRGEEALAQLRAKR